MELLSHDGLSDEVKDHALSCCSKMLVDSWDFYDESTKNNE
jgi:hypothetical protein